MVYHRSIYVLKNCGAAPEMLPSQYYTVSIGFDHLWSKSKQIVIYYIVGLG